MKTAAVLLLLVCMRDLVCVSALFERAHKRTCENGYASVRVFGRTYIIA